MRNEKLSLILLLALLLSFILALPVFAEPRLIAEPVETTEPSRKKSEDPEIGTRASLTYGSTEWVRWDDGYYFGGVGLGGPGVWQIAARFEPADLSAYNQGARINLIRVGVNDEPTAAAIKIWQGSDSDNLVEVYSQTFTPDPNAWNWILLDVPYIIDLDEELWFGVEYDDPGDGVFPAYRDETTDHDGKGNMIRVGTSGPWETLSDYGIAGDWNIQAWIGPEEDALYSLPFQEDFTGLPAGLGSLPPDWSATHESPGRWGVNNTSSAGGLSPEMRFAWIDREDIFHLITPPLDGRVHSDIELSFRYSVDHWAGTDSYTLKVQSSIEGDTWEDEWTLTPTGNIGPQTVTLNLDHIDGETFYLAWVLDGNAYDIDFWYIDDIEVSSTPITAITWTGQESDNWNNPDNWSPAFVPTGSDDVTIPSGTPNDPAIDPTVTAVVNNLTVNNLATLTIQSNATNTGTLLVNGTFTGEVTVERHLEGARWYIIGPPVVGQDIGDLLTDGDNDIAFNAADAYYGATDYNEAQNRWNDYFTATLPGGDFASGTGYLLRRELIDGLVSFSGELETGTVDVPVTVDGFRWNCVGNPYTSAIGVTEDATSSQNFLEENQNNLDASHIALYVWNDTINNYEIVNNANFSNNYSNWDTDYVQLGQGFIVRAAVDGNVTFSPGMRVAQPALMLRSPLMQEKQIAPMARSEKTQWPGVVLSATANNGADTASAGIAFQEDMSLGIDPGYDAGVFKGNPEVAVFTQLAAGDDGVDYGLQCLPPSAMRGVSLPVGLETKRTGTVRFQFEKTDLPEGTVLTFEDRKNNTEKTITSPVDTYSTTVNSGEPAYGRFYLSFDGAGGSSDDSGGGSSDSGCFIGSLKTGR